MDMNKWLDGLSESGKTMPVLSFPGASLVGVTVNELVKSADLQAKVMKAVADRTDCAASVSLMDLSVEAEAFGSEIRFSDGEVPTVIGAIVEDEDMAQELKIPDVGAARTGIYIEAIKKARELITDRPIFAGMIGPFSLGGRLIGVSDIMADCYVEPDKVTKTLEKAAAFLIAYANEYKKAGANGIVMAEPLTGMLSPSLAAEFSEGYVKRIIDEIQTDDFIVIYHNCGNNTVQMIDSILRTGAAAYHFGNAISMPEMMKHIPPDTVVMGNIDPAGEFLGGTPESIRKAVLSLMGELYPKYPNFVISSGCDIPPASPWANIDAYFAAVKEYSDNN